MRFLTAEWRDLIMLNYQVDPKALKPYIPAGTELDLWQGKALVSMVGFMFANTRVLGIKWPAHVNFEEINLRFYVRHFDGERWKRGAVFISEITSKAIIPLVANNIYNEHYQTMPTRRYIRNLECGKQEYAYYWQSKKQWNTIAAVVQSESKEIEPGSAEEFIFEHYWGYNKLTDRKTVEYQVEHITWKTREITDAVFKADISDLYGKEFQRFLSVKPYSAFFAEGSAVSIRIAKTIVI